MASGTPVRSRQDLDFCKYRAFYSLNNKLGYPVTSPEAHRMLGIGVQQDHLDLATVPRVDSAWRVDDRDAVPRGQPGARMHEGGVPIRQRDAHPGADNGTLAGREVNVGGYEQVAPGVTWMGSLRQRQPGIPPPDQYRHPPRLGAGAGHWCYLRAPGSWAGGPYPPRLVARARTPQSRPGIGNHRRERH